MGFYPNADHLRAVLAPVGRFLKICRFIWACCCAGSPLNIQHPPPPHPTFRNLSRGFRKGNQSEQRLHSRGDEDEPLALWGRSRKTLFWMHILLVDFLGIFFRSLPAGKLQVFSLWIHCKQVGQAANKAALSHLHAVDINL